MQAEQQIFRMPEPPDPWAMLPPDSKLQPGDIFFSPDRQEWRPIEAGMWGEDSPPPRLRWFARPSPPEGYIIRSKQELIRMNDMVWNPGEGMWQYVPDSWFDQPFPQPHYLIAKRPPDFRVPTIHLNVPAHHRKMHVGEALRRGDKVYRKDRDAWEDVSDDYRGREIPATPIDDNLAVFCRPVHPESQIWYFDPKHGDNKALGGPTTPFKTEEGAIQAIEAACKQFNRAPHGELQRLPDGITVMVWDLPEPQPRNRNITLDVGKSPGPGVQGMQDPAGRDMLRVDQVALGQINRDALRAMREEEDAKFMAAVNKSFEEPAGKSCDAKDRSYIYDGRGEAGGITRDNLYDALKLMPQLSDCKTTSGSYLLVDIARQQGQHKDAVRNAASRAIPNLFGVRFGNEEIQSGDYYWHIDELGQTAFRQVAPELIGTHVDAADMFVIYRLPAKPDPERTVPLPAIVNIRDVLARALNDIEEIIKGIE